MTKYVSTTTTWKNYIFGYMVATAFGVDKNLNTEDTDLSFHGFIFLILFWSWFLIQLDLQVLEHFLFLSQYIG